MDRFNTLAAVDLRGGPGNRPVAALPGGDDMTRTSLDMLDASRVVVTGYDYNLQVWVRDYVIVPCGHPEPMTGCNACKYAGEYIWNVPGHEGQR